MICWKVESVFVNSGCKNKKNLYANWQNICIIAAEMKQIHLILLAFATVLVSCTKPAGYGDLCVNIGYSVNGKAMITDSLCYTNEAGNTFMITEIQWFLSKMELQDERGEWISLEHRDVDNLLPYATDRIFYIDTDIPESQTLAIAPVPVGRYKTLRFTFGLDEEDNLTGLFSDPPESEMFWPEQLGGGYHYMKLNGKYLNTEGRLAPLAIHLGIGQNEDFTEFYQNYFTVELPLDFIISANTENKLDLTMVVDNWFRSPNTIDFNVFGSHIMQNQDAQRLISGNGSNVFRIGKTTAMEKDNKLAEKFRNAMRLATPQPHFWSWKNIKERMRSPVGTTDNTV